MGDSLTQPYEISAASMNLLAAGLKGAKFKSANSEVEGVPIAGLGEADVWHEGSKSFYRAKLLSKLTEREALDPMGESLHKATDPSLEATIAREQMNHHLMRVKERFGRDTAKSVIEFAGKARKVQDIAPEDFVKIRDLCIFLMAIDLKGVL